MTVNKNQDAETVDGFGREWDKFTFEDRPEAEIEHYFDLYFRIFPWDDLPKGAVGFDVGCGTGRWAKLVAPRVGRLICVDAAEQALAVARRNLASTPNVEPVLASVGELPFASESMDFGYSLGVLHHVPDTQGGIDACVRALKPGAPFLVYLYYALDNRPAYYRWIWRTSDAARRVVSRMPFPMRYATSQALAAGVYYPLARTARALERAGLDVTNLPLSSYRDQSFYVMRTDALDRFGTRLEQRFTRVQIERMMVRAGLEDIRFSDDVPYWCAVGRKKRQ
jgi:SAM-dependent methyltransferase